MLYSLLVGLPSCTINRLQLVQNATARLITSTHKHDHITGALRMLHWLPIKARIEFKILLLTFKALNGTAPPYLTELLVFKQNARILRSSNDQLLIVPKSRLKTIGDRSFCVAAAKLWNNLPQNIRLCSSLENFKSLTKTFLFQRHF